MITLSTILLLCLAAFAAGFVDAVVGGGGLLQVPAGLVLLPQFPVATVMGTLKIPAFSGTSFAAAHYVKKVQINFKLLLVMCVLAFLSSLAGALVLVRVSNQFMKPLLLVVLCGVAVYTYTKKNLGTQVLTNHSEKKQMIFATVISMGLGFYDGFIGPGTGSFLVLAFIAVFGFDFLNASASAKLVNLATNLASVLFFVFKGTILWSVALPMAVSNALGGTCGARVAIRKGNRFIRIFFLCVVVATLIRFACDVFW